MRHEIAGCPALGVNQVSLRRFSLAAVVGDKTAVPNDCDGKQVSGLDSSDSSPINDEVNRDRENEDEKGSVEGLDNHKMIRVCDKLIEVFLVDKPTPTDWRRLLAFSKEWSSIRPHFFQRCQDRADVEADPGMKHKLLRLGRKLKEVGHLICNDLLTGVSVFCRFLYSGFLYEILNLESCLAAHDLFWIVD